MAPVIIFIPLFLLIILPLVLVLLSNKAQGADKLIWFIASFFASWLGYLLAYYFVIKNVQKNPGGID
jgi:hypothetical protein